MAFRLLASSVDLGLVDRSPSDSTLRFFCRSGPCWACPINTPPQGQLEVGSLCQHPSVLASSSSLRLYALFTLLFLSGPTFFDPSGQMLLDPYGRCIYSSSPSQLRRCRGTDAPRPVGSPLSTSALAASLSVWPSHDPSHPDHSSLSNRLSPIHLLPGP